MNKYTLTKLIGSILCISCLTHTVSAFTPINNVHHHNNVEIEFISDSSFNDIQKENIINSFINVDILINSSSDTAIPASLSCTLFGHKLTTESVTATTHKVNPLSPRCRTELYSVSSCSRCDYVEKTLVSSKFVNCCTPD